MNNIAIAFKSLESSDSPLFLAPEKVFDYLTSLKQGKDPFLQLSLQFEPHISPKKVCTRLIQGQEKYYHCQTCAKDLKYKKMIYCAPCFIKQDHEGHQYSEQPKDSQPSSCDCGRGLRLKKSCHLHSNKGENVSIPEDDGKQFRIVYRSLFDIWAYTQENKQSRSRHLLQKIVKSLIKICTESSFYCRLTINVLKQEMTIKGKKTSLFAESISYPELCDLIYQLVGDEQFLIQYGKYFMEKQKERKPDIFNFSKVRSELIDSESFLLLMLESNSFNFCSESIKNYFEIAKGLQSKEKRIQLIFQILQQIERDRDQSQYIDTVWMILTKEEYSWLLEQNLRIFVHKVGLKILSFYEHPPKQIEGQKKGEIDSQKKHVLKKSFSIIASTIFLANDDNILKVQEQLEVLYQEKQFKNRIQNLVAELISNVTEFLKQKHRDLFLFVLLILERHENRDNLLETVWSTFLKQDQGSFPDILERVFEVIGYIANSYRTFPILGLSEVQDNLSRQQIMEQLFRSYLFQNKQIGKKILWSEYSKGWLQFDGCGKILNQLCEFNNSTDTFIYKSPNLYPNNLLKIPLQVSKNYQNIKKMDINYKSSKFCQSPLLRKFFLILFKDKHFYNAFKIHFEKGLGMIEKDVRALEKWKQRSIGDHYITLLVLIHKICDGEEYQEIIQQIQNIRSNKDECRFKFTEIGNEEKMKKILCIDLPEQIQIEEEGQEKRTQISPEKVEDEAKKEQRLKKAQKMKESIQNKFKKKQQVVFEKMKYQKSSVHQEQQEENFCLSCKQRERKDNQFINLIHISKGNTVSKILHADESKTDIKISTNIHTIHLNCYKEMKKKNMEFQCPLCKQNINSFLPYRPNKASKQTLRICWSVANAVLVSVFNTFEYHSLFEVLLIGCLESLGFSELISSVKSKNLTKFKRKVDHYILENLECLFSFSSEQEKSSYRSSYKRLKEKIEKCSKQQIKLFQLVVLDSIYFRISGEIEVDKSQVERLAKYMIEEELAILRTALEFITLGNSSQLSQILSSFEDLSMEQIPQNSLKQEKNLMKITSLEKIQQPQQLKQQEEGKNQQKQQNQVKSSTSLSPIYRRSLGISVEKPPRQLENILNKSYLLKISSQFKCSCESVDIQQICLLCKRGFCEKCTDDQNHSQIHLNNFMTLDLTNGKLTVVKNSKSEKYDIYYNQFMIEYQKNRKDQDEDSEDQQKNISYKLFVRGNNKKAEKKGNYILQTSKFNDILEKFFNLL